MKTAEIAFLLESIEPSVDVAVRIQESLWK
jgi:hypothetical protein